MNGFLSTSLDRQAALELDRHDPLADFRNRFYLQPGNVYLDGNSLGLLSRDAEAAVLRALEEWKTLAIDGWTKAELPWFELPERLGAESAELVGALPHEVVVAGGTTINLHTLLATFYKPVGARTKIVADSENFPSDLYALYSHLQLHGRPDSDLVLVRPGTDGFIDEADVIHCLNDDVALLLLPSVWYKSGQLLDIERVAAAAHERGVVFGVDCCHSAGVVPHRLHDWGVDFAVWCNYKYLNSGPGATASLFVHERHHGRLPGLAGWFGSDKQRQFDMAFPMTPAHTAGQWQIGTPPVLSTAPVGAALRIHKEAGIARIREKSLRQTAYLRHLLQTKILDAGLGGRICTPLEDDRRGGHIAFEHDHAVAIAKALKDHGVIPDFRPPRTIRLAPIPLYTSYADVWDAVDILRRILADQVHLRYSGERDVVS